MNTADDAAASAAAAATVRQAGADVIAARAVVIGVELGVAITQCVWDIGQDLGHQHAHRLDLFADVKTVRLYFPDLELTDPAHPGRKKRTDDRLRSAIAQMAPREPAPTYLYR